MRQAFGGGGFLGLTNTLRSLTAASPISTAVQEAHRMARRRLEAGGPAAPTPKPAEADPILTDFVLPLDVDADEVHQAIEAKLRGGASLQTDRHAASD